MQCLSFAHTSVIRAYCQLYYCGWELSSTSKKGTIFKLETHQPILLFQISCSTAQLLWPRQLLKVKLLLLHSFTRSMDHNDDPLITILKRTHDALAHTYMRLGKIVSKICIRDAYSRCLLRFVYSVSHQTTQYLNLMDRFRGNKIFF